MQSLVLIITSTSVGTNLYPHMPILRPHAVRYSTNGASLAWFMAYALTDL